MALQSWENIVFFRDRKLFVAAFRWCNTHLDAGGGK
jgi:hypothetical protein